MDQLLLHPWFRTHCKTSRNNTGVTSEDVSEEKPMASFPSVSITVDCTLGREATVNASNSSSGSAGSQIEVSTTY